MSHYMTALAMRQTGLKPAAKIVLYWLADHHNETTGECFPSIARLADLSQMSRRSVEQHLAALEASGLVEITQRHRPEGGKTSNAYILRLVDSDAQNLRIPPAKFAHGDTQNLRMNNLGRYNLGKEQESLPACVSFSEFWSLMPQGAKTGKREAEKAWRKLTPEEREVATKSAAGYFGFWRRANPQASWLHPSTYLNQRRWEDEAWQPAQEGPAVDRAAFWAECINQGKFVSTATCPPQMCKEMLDRKLVTQRQLLERGLVL